MAQDVWTMSAERINNVVYRNYEGDTYKLVKENEMASRIMRRSEAERFICNNGSKLFLDMCIKEAVMVMPDREIEPLYSLHALDGAIELETWSDMGLTLKINGEIVYQRNK